MSCHICASEDVAERFLLECDNCHLKACRECQRQYAKTSCMQCKVPFPISLFKSKVGAGITATMLRQQKMEGIMQREKSLLPAMKKVVEWYRLKEYAESRRRFGEIVRIPERPKGGVAVAGNFLCPREACPGFVPVNGNSISRCSSCTKGSCSECREAVDGDHTCNPQVVESVRELMNSCRNCPACHTSIFRTMGCDHMRCTNCGIHFNWQTLKVLKVSTNGHYNNVRILNPRQVAPNDDEPGEDVRAMCHENMTRFEQVPADRLAPILDRELSARLYSEAHILRSIWQGMNVDQFGVSYTTLLEDARVQFLLKKIDEKKWSQRILRIEKDHEKKVAIRDILGLYLLSISQFQLELRDHPEEVESVRTRIRNLVELCNRSFSSIEDEAGGKRPPTLRVDPFDESKPVFSM